MKTLDGKVVVITGAGSGIGRALTLEVARRGSLVAVSDIDEVGLAETVDLVKDIGAEVHADHVDVSSRTQMAAYAANVADHYGRVNVIVNNAGVSLSGDFADLDYDDMEWLISINFWGVVHGTHEFLPHLIASGDGHVVNLSSLFGLVAIPGQSVYNASKFAVRGLTEALREEMLMAGHRVGVTSVHPGGIQTAIVRNSRVAAGDDKAALTRLFDDKLARTSAEKAASVIVSGVLHNKARVLVGLDAHVLHQFGRVVGSRYQDVVARVSRRVLPDPR